MLTSIYNQRVAVMCFANATKAGGAYQQGAQAQEEDFTRRTECREVITRDRPGANNDWQHTPEARYPLAPGAGHYTRGVMVLRGGRNEGYGSLPTARQFLVDMMFAPF